MKPKVSYLRISSCPVYTHVLKKKRMKLEPFGKDGTFVVYNKTSKAYRIYILGQCQIEANQDVTFDGDIFFRTSRGISHGD